MTEPKYKEFELNIFSELMHFGNRTDGQIYGVPEDDDWYSWRAEELDFDPVGDNYSAAMVSVYGDEIVDQKYVVLWKRIYD